MKTKLKKKKRTKAYFIQNWGTYSNQTFVVVGMKGKEILRAMKRAKLVKEAITDFEKEHEELDKSWLVDGHNGMCWIKDGRSLLWVREWKDDWDHHETLIHEIFHLVHAVLQKGKNMANEDEACAYQQEYLYRQIRRNIFKLFPR